MKSKVFLEEAMSKSGKSRHASKRASIELVHLALLELRKRQLRRELANVECQYRQLELEIELKGIQMPWVKNRNS